MKTLLMLSIAAVIAGCSPKVTETESPSGSELGFSINLFRNAVKHSGADENITVSPYSAGVAISMLTEGADGQTKVELDNALNGCLFRNTDLGNNDSLIIDSANSVWLDDDFSVRNSYVNHLSKEYDALVTTLRFSDPETVKAINNWCSENTEGMIDNILDELTPQDVMVLINALYFKAPWQNPFDPSSTSSAVFHGSEGEVTVPFMNQKLFCDYVEYEGNQMVRLPYKGDRYSMYILLPSEKEGVQGLLPYITENGLKEVLSHMSQARIKLSVPKFRTETGLSLVKTLESMGVRSVFSSAADLTGIAHGPLSVSDVIQKTVVDVDETGSEAAAVTAIRVRMTSARIDQDPVMNVNRPFYYMIADMEHDRILFAGRIMNL